MTPGRRIVWCGLVIMVGVFASDRKAVAQPVIFDVTTQNGTDTIYFGAPAELLFHLDANGSAAVGVGWPVHWRFSNGNILGALHPDSPLSIFDPPQNVFVSPQAATIFESVSFWTMDEALTNPDSSLASFIDFDPVGWTGSGVLWSIRFSPLDTGLIVLDKAVRFGPAIGWPMAYDPFGGTPPTDWSVDTIYVLPCPFLMGDVNQDAVLTSADLIYFINYLFKSGPDPLPERSVGDVNCSGGLGGSDVIYLVNYLFKGGAAPCGCIVKRI